MQLNELVEQYRDMVQELQPAIDQMKQLENEIKAVILETGELPDVDGVKATIRNGYERPSWDSKALAGYAAAHPEIEQFRRVSQVGPSVSLKVS